MLLDSIEKKHFHLKSYVLENNQEIPVTLGYETYGTLNKDKSNVILVPHYFSASSHVAGKYSPEEKTVGYWDSLIGEGKALDTNKFFIISTDNLANVQVNNPKVITTGPRSLNPKTGKRWGADFPAFTFRDMAGIQREFLLNQLGITKLYAVMGASAGGMIALSWAVEYPEMVERVIGVITNAQNPTITSFSVLQHAMRAIALDPKWKDGYYEEGEGPIEGLKLAIQMMNAGAFTAEFYEKTYPRDSKEEAPYLCVSDFTSYEKKLDEAISANLPFIDASHWYYTARATMMHDLAHGYASLEEALERIKAKIMLVSCQRDMLQPTIFNEKIVKFFKEKNHSIELVKIDSEKGHMAGILDTPLFEKELASFLK